MTLKLILGFAVFLSVISIFTGCSSLSISNLNNVNNLKGNHLIYTLPKNILRVKVSLVRTSYQCGPYNRFAKKYLGINNQFTEHTTIWKISNINIESYSTPDTSAIYCITGKELNSISNLALSKEGFLLGINSSAETSISKDKETILNLKQEEKDHFVFTDLSVKKIQVNKLDTVYKKVRRDSGFVKIPEVNSTIVNKNLEDKAKEIAEQIFDIREERINLLTGVYKTTINGDAIKTIIDELGKIEEKYCSLFTTITKHDTIDYIFDYCPDKKAENKAVLCYFSERSGISLSNTEGSEPITININRNGAFGDIADRISAKTKKPVKAKGIFYRIAENADILISYNNANIASKKVLISQFGSVMILPMKYISGTKYSVEFHPETGSPKIIKETK